jgi:hypothetical protein
MDKEIYIFFKSIRTYFTGDMLKLMFLPLIISIIFFYVGFFVLAGGVLNNFENYQIQIETQSTSNDEFQNEDESWFSFDTDTIYNMFIASTATSWIASILFYTFGIVIMGYVAIFTSLIIIGFLTPKILAQIHQKNYSDVDLEAGYGNMANTIWSLIKTMFIMMVLFIGLIPFYFLPILNLFIMFIPFYYFFHKMINFDVSSTIMSKEQFLVVYEKHKTNIRTKTMLLYFVSLIPFVAFFLAIFYIIYIGISYFEILKDMQSNDENKSDKTARNEIQAIVEGNR